MLRRRSSPFEGFTRTLSMDDSVTRPGNTMYPSRKYCFNCSSPRWGVESTVGVAMLEFSFFCRWA
jgi:hypothetical protein